MIGEKAQIHGCSEHVDVYAIPGGDLRTISIPMMGVRMLLPSSLHVIEGDKGAEQGN